MLHTYDALEIKEDVENLGYLKKKKKINTIVKQKSQHLKHIIQKIILKYQLVKTIFKMII